MGGGGGGGGGGSIIKTAEQYTVYLGVGGGRPARRLLIIIWGNYRGLRVT